MKEYKKEMLIAGIILFVASIILSFILFKKGKVEAPVLADQSGYIEDETNEVDILKKVYKKTKVVDVVDNLNNISYTDAIAKYSDGRLLQFSENCQSHPYRMVVANGSDLMLDNRSKNKEIITIGENKYTLAGYGFKVISLNLSVLPTTYTVDCAISQNVNTLIVE